MSSKAETRFSKRLGVDKAATNIQIDSMNDNLKIAIWNVLYKHVLIKHAFLSYVGSVTRCMEDKTIIALLDSVFHKSIGIVRAYSKTFPESLKKLYNELPWYKIYDLTEVLLETANSEDKDKIKMDLNNILERENSAYRIVDYQVIQITSDIEIDELEEALSMSKGRFDGVHTHKKTALQFLSDRQNPNYRKSIDESVMAVESICQIICKDGNATLGKALNKIEREGTIQINSILKGAYSKIYGYASSSDGIRHALTDEPNLGYEDAKYMLVSCTSFVNYLIVKGEKAGVFSQTEDGENDE